MHMHHDPNAPALPEISFDDFLKVDMRVGTVISAEEYHEARQPSLRLQIDFGPVIGIKKSIAQIKANYKASDLIGRQVMAVVNFPPRQIGKFRSEVLTLGAPDSSGAVVLLSPDTEAPNGGRIF